jgi:hypothetical protein
MDVVDAAAGRDRRASGEAAVREAVLERSAHLMPAGAAVL